MKVIVAVETSDWYVSTFFHISASLGYSFMVVGKVIGSTVAACGRVAVPVGSVTQLAVMAAEGRGFGGPVYIQGGTEILY